MPPPARMVAPARASRSTVETPGATASRSLSRVAATSRPAVRIFPIWAGVLYSMSHSRWRMLAPLLTTVRAERVDRAHSDVLYRPGGVDADQLALRAVVVDQRRGVARIHPQPLGDGLRLVVVALEQLAAAPVADALAGRRVELDVPDLAAAPTGTPAGQPPDHLIVVDHEFEHQVDPG